MSGSDNISNDFLESLSNSLSSVNPNEVWPLRIPQMIYCFHEEFTIELKRQLTIAKRKLDSCEIAELFKMPSRIRMILSGVDIPLALKALVRKNIFRKNKTVDFINEFFSLLYCFNSQDPFCLNGTDKIWKSEEVDKYEQGGVWWETSSVPARNVMNWVVDLYNLVWVFYYAAWLPAGLQIHGPYKVKDGTLLVRDYYDLAPADIWELASDVPVRKISMGLLFRNLTGGINFLNQPHFNEVLPDELVRFRIDIENESVKELKDFLLIIKKAQDITTKQVEYVNQLDSLDQVSKASQICWYLKKDLSEAVSESWQPPQVIMENIKRNGEKFINKFKRIEEHDKNYWIKLYDVRNNFLRS